MNTARNGRKRFWNKINAEFKKEGLALFTEQDMQNIRDSVDGAFGRPHIAAYMIKKGIVQDTQEAFDRYLVKCDVPKYPLSLPEASQLIHNAGGVLVLAHGNDPGGTSLATITKDLAATDPNYCRKYARIYQRFGVLASQT